MKIFGPNMILKLMQGPLIISFSDIISYPTSEQGISLGCAKAIVNRYPGLEDELNRQIKTMIKIDFDGIASKCQ